MNGSWFSSNYVGISSWTFSPDI